MPLPKFQLLHGVLSTIYSDSPTIRCVFLESDVNSCNDTVEETDWEEAKSLVVKVSQDLSKTGDESPLPEWLSQLSKYCLCGHHMRQDGYLTLQWLSELGKPRFKREFISLLMTNDLWPPPPKVLEFTAIEPELPLGKDVGTVLETLERIDDSTDFRIDKVLRSELKGSDKIWLYVLSSDGAPGMFKIGVSKHKPTAERIKQHRRCYPNPKIIHFIAIPKYAHRVERLLLAEFRKQHFQLSEPCGADNQRHKEWLHVDEEVLVEKIDKWSEFFVNPSGGTDWYNKNGQFNPDAGQNTPEGGKDFTPTNGGRYSASKSSASCKNSQKDYSIKGGGKKSINGDSPETTGRHSSSRLARLRDESPTPPARTNKKDGDKNGNLMESVMASMGGLEIQSSKRRTSGRLQKAIGTAFG